MSTKVEPHAAPSRESAIERLAHEPLNDVVRRIDELDAAALALWRAECTAWSLRLTHELLELIAATQLELQTLSDAARLQHLRDRAVVLRDEIVARGLPTLDADCTVAHVDVLDQARRVAASWRRLTRARGGKVRMMWSRGLRTLPLLAAALIVAFGVRPPPLRVTASSRYAAHYDPARVIDGDVKTEWLLPDRHPGWIELQFRAARPIRTLFITNAMNLPYRDRATLGFRVEVFDGPRLTAVHSGELPPPRADAQGPETHGVPIQVQRADRVRLAVESHFGLGGGLAEIRVE